MGGSSARICLLSDGDDDDNTGGDNVLFQCAERFSQDWLIGL